jgi:hypothetical protein
LAKDADYSVPGYCYVIIGNRTKRNETRKPQMRADDEGCGSPLKSGKKTRGIEWLQGAERKKGKLGAA